MLGVIVFFLLIMFLILGIVTYIRHRIKSNKDVLTGSELYITNLIAVQLVNPELLDSAFFYGYGAQIDQTYPYLSRKIVNRNIKDMGEFATHPALAQSEIANLLQSKSDQERAFMVARGIKLTAMIDESNYFSEQLLIPESQVNINYNNILSILNLNNEQIKVALKREDL